MNFEIRANAKINLGLRILPLRRDGYHDLETLFYPIYGLYDVLSVEVLEGVGEFALTVEGNAALSAEGDNILSHAYDLLRPYRAPSVRIRLFKQIPTGAGLGGGSADASFFLKNIVPLCECPITQEILPSLALQLGSDCPFFLLNKPAMGRGRGEILAPLDFSLHGYYLQLVVPPVHISTREAFASIIPQTEPLDWDSLLHSPVTAWSGSLVNDFEPYARKEHPLIEEIIQRMYASGAEFVSLTGSGAGVYGIFTKQPTTVLYEGCTVYGEYL